MKIVLDTNVLIAALATRGLCTEVLEICLTEHNIILSEYILSEVKEALSSKIRLPKKFVDEAIDFLKNSAEIVKEEKVDQSICRDKNDIPVIGTALSGKAHFIITGDEDLLILKKFRNIEIVTPREFWNRLK